MIYQEIPENFGVVLGKAPHTIKATDWNFSLEIAAILK